MSDKSEKPNKPERITISPSLELEKAILGLQAEIQQRGPLISRAQAIDYFAEVGWRQWDKAIHDYSKVKEELDRKLGKKAQ